MQGVSMIIAPTEHGAQHESPNPTELLIKEARQKTRRRRFRLGLIVLAALVIIAATLVAIGRATTPVTKATGGPRGTVGANTVSSPVFSPFYFPPSQNLQFVSTNDGWIIDPNVEDRILGTTNGGRSWSTSYLSSVSAKTNKGGIVSIDFINTSDGWALLYGEGLISTTDGGRSWSAPREPAQGSVMAYTFTGPSNGWVLTSKGVLLHTLNDMTTWLTVTTPARGTSLCATPSGSLWLGESDSGSVYSSSNGESWKLSLSGSRVPAAGNVPRIKPAPWISCSATSAWLLYNWGESAGSMAYAVERTLNGGKSWKAVVSSEVKPVVLADAAGVFATVESIGSTGKTSAWILGFCGPCTTGSATVATTTNATTFVDATLPIAKSAHASPVGGTFHGPKDGWAILQESPSSGTTPTVKIVVVETTDGGMTWKVVDPNLNH
jgi:photosystem II stability/assembly factor-like uncharacterized protein